MANCTDFFDKSRAAVSSDSTQQKYHIHSTPDASSPSLSVSTSCGRAGNNGPMAACVNSCTWYGNLSLELSLAPSWLQERQGTVVRPIPTYAVQTNPAAPACQSASEMDNSDFQTFLSVERKVSIGDFFVPSCSSSVSMSVNNKTSGSFSVPSTIGFSSQNLDSESKALDSTSKDSHCLQKTDTKRKITPSFDSHVEPRARNDDSSPQKQDNLNSWSTPVSSVTENGELNQHESGVAPAIKTEDMKLQDFPEKQLSRTASEMETSTGVSSGAQVQRMSSGVDDGNVPSCSFQHQHEHMNETLELQRRRAIQAQRRQEARKRRKHILEERQQKKARGVYACNQKSANQSGKTLTDKININSKQVACNTGDANAECRNPEFPATRNLHNGKSDISKCEIQYVCSDPGHNPANCSKTGEIKSPAVSQCSEVESCETNDERINGKGISSENESSNQTITKEDIPGPSVSCLKTESNGPVPFMPPFPFFPMPYPMPGLGAAVPMHLSQGFPVPYFLPQYVNAANNGITAKPSPHSPAFAPSTVCINADPTEDKMRNKVDNLGQKLSSKKIKHRKSNQGSIQEKSERKAAIPSQPLSNQGSIQEKSERKAAIPSQPLRAESNNAVQQNSMCALGCAIGHASKIASNSNKIENPSAIKEDKMKVQKQRSVEGNSEIQKASQHSMIETSSTQSGIPSLNAYYPGVLWVSTTGQGPDGKTITGLMYVANNTHVCLVCSCHGEHMTPAQFVAHSGSSDLSNPEKNIVVSQFPLEVRL